jgi:asparagine synthase (glutamine-hydrolysing)
MCGIAGLASTRGERIDADLLARMNLAIHHRGPDDHGQWLSPDGTLGLAHRRLSIIDLSPAGHQPMADVHGHALVVFNGEIYNHHELRRELEALGHSFASHSDTEVILEAYLEWGDACIARLQGMFAFALHDVRRRRLLLARDRAGEKPLFYSWRQGRLAFASELKALMADAAFPRRMERAALDSYFAYGYVPGAQCILQHASKLPPAHYMTLELAGGEPVLARYWRLPDPPREGEIDEQALLDEFEALLGDAVGRQLMSDVPLGVMLSGGVDSSLVTALAARRSGRALKTFTISFPGRANDEGPYARLVAQHFATEHTELVAEPASVALIPELVRQFDEPIADSSIIPTFMVSRLIRPHATVALGGDGGDELFGGYLNYPRYLRLEGLRRLLPGPARSLIAYAGERLLPLGLRGRNYLLAMAGSAAEGFAYGSSMFPARARAHLVLPLGELRDGAVERAEGIKIAASQSARGLPAMHQAIDFATYLPDDILVKVDRASMLTSLEVRSPFLDHRIIEFAFAKVPNRLRATAQLAKILPKRLARKLLPAQLDIERKQGFAPPLQEWFKGELGGFISEVLGAADPALYSRSGIARMLRDQERGLRYSDRLFALTIFELWRRTYQVALP